MRILEVGRQFRPKTSHVYPPFKNGRYMEEYVYEYLLSKKDEIKTDLVYIPVFWTNLQIRSNFELTKNNIVTIDSTGIDITSRNTIHISATDNNDMVFSVDNGRIILGSGKVEQQMLLGNKMVNLISQLLDAITQMQIATPSGPSSPGPINQIIFNEIGNKLKDCLSK